MLFKKLKKNTFGGRADRNYGWFGLTRFTFSKIYLVKIIQPFTTPQKVRGELKKSGLRRKNIAMLQNRMFKLQNKNFAVIQSTD